jgi:SAM-dependent methyltransferase
MYDLLGKLPPQSTVLDLGCGGGSFHYETCAGTVFAMDLTLEGKTLRKNDPRVAYLCADSAAVPLPDGSVDAVISHNTMEHFPDYRKALAEVGRVLRSDGWLWVSVPDGYAFSDNLYRFVFAGGGGHVNRFTHDGLVEDVRQIAGLRLVAHCDLFSSFNYLKKPAPEEEKDYRGPARAFVEMPVGLSTFGNLAVNAVTRIADKLLGSRYSQYGWGFVFAKGTLQTPNPPSYFNVCRGCGSGIPFRLIVARRTLWGMGLFDCPHCKKLNVFVSPRAPLE